MAFAKTTQDAAADILRAARRSMGRWPTIAEAREELRQRTGSPGGTDRIRRLLHELKKAEIEAAADAAIATGQDEIAANLFNQASRHREAAYRAQKKPAERARMAAQVRREAEATQAQANRAQDHATGLPIGWTRLVLELPSEHASIVSELARALAKRGASPEAVLRRIADRLTP